MTLLTYAPALKSGFIWDDDNILTQNAQIRASDGLYRIWCTTEPQDYWPVTSTTLWLEWRLWGMHAAGYHVTNVALHLVEVLLLWAILRRLRMPGAYVAAFLFAVHPVNVESVAWIEQRKNLMAMLFFLLSILGFLKSEEGERPSLAGSRFHGAAWRALSLLAFALGMLSKGSIATLPIVLVGLIAWRRRLSILDWIRTAPFFFVAAIFAWLDVWFQGHHLAETIRNAGWAERVLEAGAIVWFYLYKALLPFNLIFVYPEWKLQPDNPIAWTPLLAAIGLTAFLWRHRERCRPALFAWGYFCAMLMPVMGFTNVYFMKYSLVADHYEHLALIGVVAFMASVWANGADRSERHSPPWSCVSRIAPAAAIGLLACLTWMQCRTYRDIQTLFSTTLARNPQCWLAHNNLGMLRIKEGHLSEGIVEFEEALRIKPGDVSSRLDLGVALTSTGRFTEAVAQLEEVVRVQPNWALARQDLAMALKHMGRPADAIFQYGEALRLNPNSAATHYNFANTLASTGRIPEAISHYQEALRIQPDFTPARDALERLSSDSPSMPSK